MFYILKPHDGFFQQHELSVIIDVLAPYAPDTCLDLASRFVNQVINVPVKLDSKTVYILNRTLQFTKAQFEVIENVCFDANAEFGASTYIFKVPREKKITAIKAVRAALGIGLKDAKDLTDAAMEEPIRLTNFQAFLIDQAFKQDSAMMGVEYAPDLAKDFTKYLNMRM